MSKVIVFNFISLFSSLKIVLLKKIENIIKNINKSKKTAIKGWNNTNTIDISISNKVIRLFEREIFFRSKYKKRGIIITPCALGAKNNGPKSGPKIKIGKIEIKKNFSVLLLRKKGIRITMESKKTK